MITHGALSVNIARHHPGLATCSERNVTMEAMVTPWVLLDLDGGYAAVTSAVGQRQATEPLTISVNSKATVPRGRQIEQLKQFRRVATRYEKRAANYGAMLTIAGILLWL